MSERDGANASGTGAPSAGLPEFAAPGLHDFVFGELSRRVALEGAKVVELGAGSGAFAERLRHAGAIVTASDIDDGRYADFRAETQFVAADLNRPDFASAFSTTFDLVVALELIEHLESPLSFLRNVEALVSKRGLAVVTSPNVDNLASRLLFLRTGQLRGASQRDDPNHISPIHAFLLTERLLPRTGLRLEELLRYPEHGFVPGPGWKRALLVRAGPALTRAALAGDINVYVLAPRGPARADAPR